MLVDAAGEIARASPHGSIGDEALYEHVHLTFHATWQIARLILPRIGEDLLRRGRVHAVVTEPLSYEEARQRLAFTAFDEAMIIDELLDRFSRAPFTGQSDHAWRMATWRERGAAANRLLESPEHRQQILTQYERALAYAPDDWILARDYGWILAAFGQPERAIPWLEQAHAKSSGDTDTLVALAGAFRSVGRKSEADVVLDQLREISPAHPQLPENAHRPPAVR